MRMGLTPAVAMFGVGFIAVILYRQRQPEIGVKAASGAALGALAGGLWFAISSIFEVMIILFLHKQVEARDELFKIIDQAAAKTTDPQLLATFANFKQPGGLEALIVVLLFCTFFVALILAGLGGALSGTLFARRGQK